MPKTIFVALATCVLCSCDPVAEVEAVREAVQETIEPVNDPGAELFAPVEGEHFVGRKFLDAKLMSRDRSVSDAVDGMTARELSRRLVANSYNECPWLYYEEEENRYALSCAFEAEDVYVDFYYYSSRGMARVEISEGDAYTSKAYLLSYMFLTEEELAEKEREAEQFRQQRKKFADEARKLKGAYDHMVPFQYCFSDKDREGYEKIRSVLGYLIRAFSSTVYGYGGEVRQKHRDDLKGIAQLLPIMLLKLKTAGCG